MPVVPGLRSCYAKVGPLVYFGRMLDKIRLSAAGQLPPEYEANIGDARRFIFDARCCRFLGIRHADLRERTLRGGTDEEILEWAFAHGTKRTDEDCTIWNQFMMKLGWRDDRTPILQQRIQEYGFVGRPIETMFDLLEFDEGRDPSETKPWFE